MAVAEECDGGRAARGENTGLFAQRHIPHVLLTARGGARDVTILPIGDGGEFWRPRGKTVVENGDAACDDQGDAASERARKNPAPRVEAAIAEWTLHEPPGQPGEREGEQRQRRHDDKRRRSLRFHAREREQRLMPEIGAVTDRADESEWTRAEQATDDRVASCESNDESGAAGRHERPNVGHVHVLAHRDVTGDEQQAPQQRRALAKCLRIGGEMA